MKFLSQCILFALLGVWFGYEISNHCKKEHVKEFSHFDYRPPFEIHRNGETVFSVGANAKSHGSENVTRIHGAMQEELKRVFSVFGVGFLEVKLYTQKNEYKKRFHFEYGGQIKDFNKFTIESVKQFIVEKNLKTDKTVEYLINNQFKY